MKVLVDTSVWSLVLRKQEKTAREEKIVTKLSKIIRDLNLVMIGPIRQEILSGISDNKRFEDLRCRIAVFPDYKIKTIDYETAARFLNECRGKGIQGSHIDFLICAVAKNNGFAIFTLDNDFYNYQKYIGIKLEEAV